VSPAVQARSLDALAIRRALGRNLWAAPYPFGPDGWVFDDKRENGRIIASVAPFDGAEWIHASIAYEVFAPPADHVNLHQFARHLWARLDGQPALPLFSAGGLI